MIFKLNSSAPISVNNIASNFIVQLNPNQYLLSVIERSPIECRCPRNRENNMISPLPAMINLPTGCTIYSTDFIIPAVNSFSSKLPITLWGYQFDPFINKSNPLIPINFKIMSDFVLNNLTEMKINFILSKLPPITDVHIVNYLNTLKHIDNAYNSNFPLYLIIVIAICSILVASLLVALLICPKCTNKCNQYFTQCGEKKPEAPTVEMMAMTFTTTNPDIHTKV